MGGKACEKCASVGRWVERRRLPGNRPPVLLGHDRPHQLAAPHRVIHRFHDRREDPELGAAMRAMGNVKPDGAETFAAQAIELKLVGLQHFAKNDIML